MKVTAYALSLIILILREYFSYMKKRRDNNEEGKLEIAEFKKVVDAAIIRLKESYKEENNQVGSVEDQMDTERDRHNSENVENSFTSIEANNFLDGFLFGHTKSVIDEVFEKKHYVSYKADSVRLIIYTTGYLSPYILIYSPSIMAYFFEKLDIHNKSIEKVSHDNT